MSNYFHKKDKPRPMSIYSESSMEKQKATKDCDSKDTISSNDMGDPNKPHISHYRRIIFPNQLFRNTNLSSVPSQRSNKIFTECIKQKSKL